MKKKILIALAYILVAVGVLIGIFYLTDFLSELESGAQKSEIQKERAHEIYSEYTETLKGNSYIHTKWSDLEKKGLL